MHRSGRDAARPAVLRFPSPDRRPSPDAAPPEPSGRLRLALYDGDQEIASRQEFLACWYDDGTGAPFLAESVSPFPTRLLETSVVLASMLRHLVQGGLPPEETMVQGAILLACAAADAGVFPEPGAAWSALRELLPARLEAVPRRHGERPARRPLRPS